MVLILLFRMAIFFYARSSMAITPMMMLNTRIDMQAPAISFGVVIGFSTLSTDAGSLYRFVGGRISLPILA